MAIRTSSNVKVPKPGTPLPVGAGRKGRSVEPLYDEIIETYLDSLKKGQTWIAVASKVIKKDKKKVETLRMMLNQRLEARKPNLRYEVKVLVPVLTQEMKDEDKQGYFDGYELGDRVVLLAQRDQESDPYDPSEKKVVKNQGQKVNAPKD